jgi:hypothetical protein
MANVKVRYAQVTRAAKQALTTQKGTASGSKEEERLFAKFRSRAREDFRTLTPQAANSSTPKS